MIEPVILLITDETYVRKVMIYGLKTFYNSPTHLQRIVKLIG